MLVSFIIDPDVFSETYFDLPLYHVHLEFLLKGIRANGLVLVDKDNRMYEALVDAVEQLASAKKGQHVHILFEELVKRKREWKLELFVQTNCRLPGAEHSDPLEVLGQACHASAIIVSERRRTAQVAPKLTPEPTYAAEYLQSSVEETRRRAHEDLPYLDKMIGSDFDKLIIDTTRYSRWLRFYDKQIGKATNLAAFKQGVSALIELWVKNCHFPRSELSCELITVADESTSRKKSPSECLTSLQSFVKSLTQEFSISIQLRFKQDKHSITHPRHLQAQSAAILFERGFDIVDSNGNLKRSTIKLDQQAIPHLREYRQLPDYQG